MILNTLKYNHRMPLHFKGNLRISIFSITDCHALDPVVEVAEVEYATLCAFTKPYFLSFVVMLRDGAR